MCFQIWLLSLCVSVPRFTVGFTVNSFFFPSIVWMSPTLCVHTLEDDCGAASRCRRADPVAPRTPVRVLVQTLTRISHGLIGRPSPREAFRFLRKQPSVFRAVGRCCVPRRRAWRSRWPCRQVWAGARLLQCPDDGGGGASFPGLLGGPYTRLLR